MRCTGHRARRHAFQQGDDATDVGDGARLVASAHTVARRWSGGGVAAGGRSWRARGARRSRGSRSRAGGGPAAPRRAPPGRAGGCVAPLRRCRRRSARRRRRGAGAARAAPAARPSSCGCAGRAGGRFRRPVAAAAGNRRVGWRCRKTQCAQSRGRTRRWPPPVAPRRPAGRASPPWDRRPRPATAAAAPPDDAAQP
eukprot:ctg_2868.g464